MGVVMTDLFGSVGRFLFACMQNEPVSALEKIIRDTSDEELNLIVGITSNEDSSGLQTPFQCEWAYRRGGVLSWRLEGLERVQDQFQYHVVMEMAQPLEYLKINVVLDERDTDAEG